MTNHAVSNRTDLRERTKTMSRHGDRPGQIADFRGSFETINWLYLLFKCGIKTKKHFEWVLWHWSSLGQLNLEPTRPNGLVGCKVPTYTYLPNCRFWPTAYGDTVGATTGVNISDIVWVVDPSAWSRAYAIHWLYCLYWLLCTWCTLGSGVDQELSISIGQALPWTCQQKFWFDSSGGWVGVWIAEALWCQIKLVECFEYVGEQMGGHLEHGKFCLDEDAILKRFWLGIQDVGGTAF